MCEFIFYNMKNLDEISKDGLLRERNHYLKNIKINIEYLIII